MATPQACPSCGTAMRAIVWGYGTIADVADAGDVVIGGCVVDVDEDGRVAALQCPACGTRADAGGFALEQPEPVVAVVEHPFSAGVAPATTEREGIMADAAQQPGFSAEDFGGAVGEGSWPGRSTPYSSREDALPPPSAPAPEHVEPYASRWGDAPPPSAPMPEHVRPYASREDALPEPPAAAPDHVEPYAARAQDDPPRVEGAWQERIDPFDAPPAAGADPASGSTEERAAGEAAPEPAGGAIDAVPSHDRTAHDRTALDTSDFTDAEEEGWPPGRPD